MNIESVSDLRIGDVVRKDGKAFVVADVVGNEATVTRSHVITVPDGWELVSRSVEVGYMARLHDKIRELEETISTKDVKKRGKEKTS